MKKDNKNNISYEIIVQEDPDTGDLIVPIPQELLDSMGWKEGDEIEWQEGDDSSWFLVKKGSV